MDVQLISPAAGERHSLRRLWRYRELVWVLARRDLVVRYRQTLLGVAWLLARPAAQVVIFTLLFDRLAQLPAGGVPYPVLVLSGALCYHLFRAVVQDSAISLTNNPHLLSSINFPRLLLPLASLAANSVDALITLLALLLLMLAYGLPLPWSLLALPLPLLYIAGLAFGAGLWACAGCVRFRDLVQGVPFALQILLLLSPVGYASLLVPERLGAWQWLFYANPLAIGIDGLRACVFGSTLTGAPSPGQAALGLGVGLATLLGGWLFFHRQERFLADAL